MDDDKIKYVVMIQRIYKLKRIKRFLCAKSMQKLDSSLCNLDYSSIMKKVIDKKLLINMDIFMLFVNRYLNPEKTTISKSTTRIFLSLYLIKYHGSEIFTTVSKKIRDQLYNISTHLIDFLNSSFLMDNNYKRFSMYMFGIMFNDYHILYKIALEQDRQGLIADLYRNYTNIKTTRKFVVESSKYDHQQKLAVIEELDRELKETKSCLKFVDKNYDSNNFDHIVSIEDEITNRIKEEYWQNLLKELNEENFTTLVQNLIELKNIIVSLYPEKSNSSSVKTKSQMKYDLDNKIDIDQLQTDLKSKNLTKIDIYDMAYYLFQSVIYLQAFCRDVDTSKFWHNLAGDYKNDIIDTNMFIVTVIKELYMLIDIIWKDIIVFTYAIKSKNF